MESQTYVESQTYDKLPVFIARACLRYSFHSPYERETESRLTTLNPRKFVKHPRFINTRVLSNYIS